MLRQRYPPRYTSAGVYNTPADATNVALPRLITCLKESLTFLPQCNSSLKFEPEAELADGSLYAETSSAGSKNKAPGGAQRLQVACRAGVVKAAPAGPTRNCPQDDVGQWQQAKRGSVWCNNVWDAC